jgi:hypothetical protein
MLGGTVAHAANKRVASPAIGCFMEPRQCEWSTVSAPLEQALRIGQCGADVLAATQHILQCSAEHLIGKWDLLVHRRRPDAACGRAPHTRAFWPPRNGIGVRHG